MSYRFDAKKVVSGLVKTESKAMLTIKMYAQTAAKRMEGDAKSQARWTDRTGHARQRLIGYVTDESTGIRVNLAHGVDYGLWLEVANEKRFAIVEPIVRLSAPFILESYTNLLNKMR